MFTSRAEYRLMLRYSNTFERLLEHSSKFNLLPKEKSNILEKALRLKNEAERQLNESFDQKDIKNNQSLNQKTPAKKILKRPGVSIFDLPIKATQKHQNKLPKWLNEDLLYDLESDIKYEGYIKRHKKEIETLRKNEHLKISLSLSFSSVPGLSKEAIDKLNIVKPENLGQAKMVSGVTPADISALHVFLSK
jgi:NAD/FAD-utilizing enzyme apparently involved in cell division